LSWLRPYGAIGRPRTGLATGLRTEFHTIGARTTAARRWARRSLFTPDSGGSALRHPGARRSLLDRLRARVLLSVRTIPADGIRSPGHAERVDPDEQQDRECGPMR
jgi:hypothetical protein